MKKSLKKIWQSKKMVVTLHSQKGNNLTPQDGKRANLQGNKKG